MKEPPARVQILFGQVVRQRRLALGLSQEELGFATGLHRNYIGGVERGERNIALVNIFKLADGLQVTPAELFAATDAVDTRS